MNELNRVSGSACLDYIERPIGFVDKSRELAQGTSVFVGQYNFTDPRFRRWYAPIIQKATGSMEYCLTYNWSDSVSITKFSHNTSKRICGYVRKKYDDGGLEVVILGSERCNHHDNDNMKNYSHLLMMFGNPKYTRIPTGTTQWKLERMDGFQFYPDVDYYTGSTKENKTQGYLHIKGQPQDIESFDTMIYYEADVDGWISNQTYAPSRSCMNYDNMSNYMLTNDPDTTLVFGEGYHSLIPFRFGGEFMNDPLVYMQGDLYDLIYSRSMELYGLAPLTFESDDPTQTTDDIFNNYTNATGEEIYNTNLVAIPYNIVLTENLAAAQNYITNGTLPPDAYLFPLDWEKLPTWGKPDDPDDPSDNPPDEPDDNTPDDEDDDIDDNPPEAPDRTAAMMSNYNWYWLSIPDFSSFISWFWHDVGSVSDIDDLINKIEGLYNDLASAVLMVRYMPVNPEYLGGVGSPENIKLGMIEKAGAVDTLAMGRPPVVEIGRIEIPRKYNSFLDLAPYSQLSLYLPYHGYIDLDVNIFSGHWLYVYGIYDAMSGTIQYLIYRVRDSKRMLVNSVIAKIAVDIPITLQTKNDRDSAIFSNVSSTVGGLIGAVGGIASGNPIGMVMGATQGLQAFSSSNASAPLNVKGTVAETGAMYSPHKCSIILRRPTIQPSDYDESKDKHTKGTWLKYIGRTAAYGYTLGSKNMIGSGLTICENPRITFNNSTPLQSEVDEIYDYLTKGVIL